MKKSMLYTLIASMSMTAFAAHAEDASTNALTSKGYVDDGLRYVYDVANGTKNGAVKDIQTALSDGNGGLVDVGDLADTVDDNATAIGALETAVGDNNGGLVKDVADLKTTVGNASSGLVKRVNDLEQSSIVYSAGDGIAVTPGATSSDPSTIGLNISNVQNNTTYVYKTNGSGVGTWQAMEVETTWSDSDFESLFN